jgi:hypothetical protein
MKLAKIATGTPAGERPCTATPRVVGTRNGGFRGEVTVASSGTATLDGWTVRFTLPGGQGVTQVRSGTVSAAGPVTVQNVSYHGALGAGTATTFGFLVSGPGAASLGAATCTSP